MTSKLYELFLQRNPSPQERLDLGKSIRKQVNRSLIGDFTVDTTRYSHINILLEQAKSRIPEYIPIRHARMAVNPFAFFRGGAAIMANDLAGTQSPPITVQLCGDMHVSNFGFFSTTEHQLVFGINDFDETLPGNFDWDLKRLTASAMIASQLLGQDQAYGEMIVRNITSTYRHFLHQYVAIPYIDLKRTFIDENALIRSVAKHANKASKQYLKILLDKARKNSGQGVIGKLTEVTPDGIRLVNKPPLIEHLKHSFNGGKISDLNDEGLNSYIKSLSPDRKTLLLRYKWIDWARKIVGVGSVGTSCWIMYFEGNNTNDPLFLQTKQAQKSVLDPFFPDTKFPSEGERVVSGQSLIQGAPDLFLGFGTTSEVDFYIRQLRDMKGGISVGGDGINAKVFPDFAKLFGWALANAHARSGDAAVLAGYCGKGTILDDALVKFSIAYSKQNEADYATFLKAIKSGEISCAKENF
ncbi:DUF2252 domain-containing protein [Polynucleobacter sp. JS-Safj-400b-B2]|uniref:DUF2252 domain-containing protein n=1 Tax=Polynucleobacter sp. JS-Safj-400b-B2 TaxID=2576921 RepID=UPI001C0DD6B2|nr:DUF2252 domain-containing protein [Polynucleobacter sp. JS-Safj-400b-B2]MBU3627198.1 DUF2252 domain-containing protein [Polynucleobacter sp. JS-Safj-400b-B2]